MSRTPWLLPVAATAGVVAVGMAWRSRWRASALWFGLGLVGYAASLQLVDAGPFVRYQHYLSPIAWLDVAPLATALLALQLVTVAVGLWAQRRVMGDRLRLPVRGGILAVAGTAFVLTSATLSAKPLAYATELAVASLTQVIHLANALLVGLALPDDVAEAVGRRIDAWLGPGSPGRTVALRPIPDRPTLLLAGLAVLIPAGLAIWVYQLHPHVPDEVAYLLHARYFAAGRLWLPVPEPFAAFDVDLMFSAGGKWYSPVPPGWPAMLAVGAWLGAPWMVNPILNGVNVLLASCLLQELYDRRTARVGAAFFALSPWNLFLAMSVLTHTFTITAALAAAVGVARWKRTGRAWGWMLGGVGIGIVSLIRPLEGLIVAVALGLWTLAAKPLLRGIRGSVALAATTVAVAAVTLPYNAALTGSAVRFPLMLYTDTLYGPRSNALGFGPERGLGWSGLDPLPGHGVLDVLINSNLNLFALNVELLGWATGSVVLLLAALAAPSLLRGDRQLLAILAAVVGAHAFYWFAGGPDFGPRYWYLITLPCAGLAARGALALAGPAESNPSRRGRRGVALAALMAGSLLVFIPWRAGDKYYHYRGMRPDIGRLADAGAFGRGLVLVAGKRHPDLASAAYYNPLDLDEGGPVFAWDRSPEVRRALLERFADRPVWLVDGPSLTGGPFRIRAGPLNAATLLTAP